MKRAFISSSFEPSFACYLFLFVIVLVKKRKKKQMSQEDGKRDAFFLYEL